MSDATILFIIGGIVLLVWAFKTGRLGGMTSNPNSALELALKNEASANQQAADAERRAAAASGRQGVAHEAGDLAGALAEGFANRFNTTTRARV